MAVKITTLAENTVPQGATGLLGEHGQSFYIETDKTRALFDVGQGLVLLSNAAYLGIDLKRVDTVVLSHGHNDHTGGLNPLLELNSSFTLFADPVVFSEKLVKTNGELRSRGAPVDAAFLEKKGVRLRFDTTPVQIAPGLTTTGEIPMETEFETLEPVFFTKQNGETVPDRLPDDRALILDTEKGPVVLLGCTHRGIINTLTQVRRLTGKEKIHAVIGGLHLGKAGDEKLTAIVKSLRAFDIDRIGVGHCTGMRAARRLMDAFGDRVFPNAVGTVFRF